MIRRYREAKRPDLAARFAEGQFGFQLPGESVTPEFNRSIHVKPSLPVLDSPILMLWDFGHNPTCLISQITPMSNWNFLEAYVGEGMGTLELIEDVIKGRIADRFKGLPLSHCGDPQGKQRSDASIEISAVRVIKDHLGGRWKPGPKEWPERRDSAKRCLGLLRNGTGLVQIDEVRAKPLWHALRGGWHYQVHNNGMVSPNAKKDIHSHPGDAFGYGAAVYFPAGQLKQGRRGAGIPIRQPAYFRRARRGAQPAMPGFVTPFDDSPDESVPPASVPDHGERLRMHRRPNR
jgi:hypothetical protein